MIPPETVVFDTDVASLGYRGELSSSVLKRLLDQCAGLTFVTVGELTRWSMVRRWGGRRRTLLEQWIAHRLVLPYNEDVARPWGRMSAAATRRGRPRPANDTWIAACCVVHGLPLATRNVRDFGDFPQHDGLRLITE